MAGQGDRRRSVAGRAAVAAAGAGPLLGQRLRLAQGRSEAERLPQFMTSIDGVDIHFIHVRSRHPNALPLIIAHGWPGSVFEQIKLIGPLTDPTKYGGRAEDAFDVVIPSLPGFGFSSRPTEAGWGLERIGRAFDVLMKRLGYTRYVAQGGDWGSASSRRWRGRRRRGCWASTPTCRRRCRPKSTRRSAAGPPGGLSDAERAVVDDALSAYPQRRERGLRGDDGRAAAGRRLRHDRLPRRPRRVAARPPGLRRKWTYGKRSAGSRRRETTCWTTSRCIG